MEDVQRTRAMEGEKRTQGKRSMSCRRKGGIKGTEEGRMLIHYYPWRLLPMSLSEHLGRAEASCGAIKEETRWRGCRSCYSNTKAVC